MKSTSELTWQEAVEAARRGESKAFDDLVCHAFEQQHKKALIPLVGSAAESWQIYLLAVTKFWEKYILTTEELPQRNINGYLFMMCKNAYYDECRKKNSGKAQREVLVDNFNVLPKTDNANFKDDSLAQGIFADQSRSEKNQSNLRHLTAAIEKICDTCRTIIEENVLGKIKLIELREKLKYGGGYQAIVQKKKRCLKKLTKLFYQELNRT